MNELIKTKGTIEFAPPNKTKKHDFQKEWKRIAIVNINDDLCEYYQWFIFKRFGIKLNQPLRNSHVSFINDKESEIPNFEFIKEKYNGKEVELFFSLIPKTNNKHWWFDVYSNELEDIREEGGGTRKPYFGLHLTIGIVKEKDFEFQEYIFRNLCALNR